MKTKRARSRVLDEFVEVSGDLAKAVAEIRSSYAQQLRIPYLASSCGLSVSAFERRFKRQFLLSGLAVTPFCGRWYSSLR